MSHSIAYARSLAIGFISLTLLFFAGSVVATESVGPMATGRSSHVAASLPDGRALVAGGFLAGSANATSSAEVYDPATGMFSPTAPLSAPRAYAAAARLPDGRVLVVGGIPVNSSPATVFPSAEIYDPVAGTWTATGTMSAGRQAAQALALPSGMVLVIAGDSTGQSCELYDPATGTFAATGSLTVSRSQFVANLLQDGRVLVAGGGQPGGPSLASGEIWDPITGAWSATGSMSSPRASASAITLGNGKVLVAGGTATYSWDSAVAASELYDPATGVFSAAGNLSVPRNRHVAALLGDGNVIVTGGISAASSLTASIERYDVAGGYWQSVGPMTSPRSSHTASTLLSGKVLIAGGTGGYTVAEIVDPACVPSMPTISPGSASFPVGGGSGSVSVTYAAACGWRVANTPSWITITSGTQGAGDGTVTFSVVENTTSSGRGATLSIADNSFLVNQPGNPCASATLSPASQSFGYAGGSSTMSLSAGASCAWTVTSPSWVTVVSGGAGSASIPYTVATNPGGARSATIAIANRNLVISQAANVCVPTPTISPASRSFTVSGGTFSVSITAPFGCTWTVTGLPSWITMTQSGSGNATLNITAAANAGAERSATFSVAGNSFTVTQAANLCADATLSPTSTALTAVGGTGTVSLTAASACTWTVGGIPSWMTVTSGTSGAGSATISYSVSANGAAARSATLTIAGRSFAVSQGAAACYPAPWISPSALSFTATAGNGTGSVNVNAPAGCSWAVTGVPAWITVTSPLSGGGNGVVTYSVPANLGSARSATMIIANNNHAVSQSAPGTATLPTGRMLTVRVDHAAATLADGRVLVTGGYAGAAGYPDITATAEIYDPSTETFSATAPLAQVRAHHVALRLSDGRVLVVGGVTYSGGTGQWLASAEIYDPATGTWAPTGSMSAARRSPVAVALPDGRILVTGGDSSGTFNGVSIVATSEIFDPATGTFAVSGSMLTPRYRPAATALPDGRVLLAGGWNSNSYLATAELWDPASGTWSATGSMTTARGDGPTATALANGKVLVAGGYMGSGYATGAELYDPATGTFSLTGNFNRARSGHLAVTLADGSVAAVGGSGSFGNIERFNVAAGAWQVVGQLSDDRLRPAASLLPNGKILVAGGFPGPLASAELFDPAVCPTPATLSATSQNFGGSGGSGSISVTLTAGCPRTVSGFLPFWISASGSGSGSGTVTYSVAANNGPARDATFSIAGASFAVTQSAGGAASCPFAGTVSAPGTYSGSLAATDCTFGARGTSYYTDRYSFDASPGQQVAFQLSSSAFDTYLYLKNPSGTVIASNDDGGGGTNSRIPATAGVFTLPAGVSGTYVIEVTSYSQRITGAYTLLRIQ